MSVLFTIISTIIIYRYAPKLILFEQLSPPKNVLILMLGIFCFWFTFCYLIKRTGGFLIDASRLKKNIRDKLRKLSHEEKIVIATMFYTRDLPSNMVGLESLESKGIIEVNEKVVYRGTAYNWFL